MSTIKNIYYGTTALVDFIPSYFSQALSDATGLETLDHGTTWKGYRRIRVLGYDPELKTRGVAKGLQFTRKTDVYLTHSGGKSFAHRRWTIGRDFDGNHYDIRKKFDYEDDQLGFGVQITKRSFLQKTRDFAFARTVSFFDSYMSGVAAGVPYGNGILSKMKQYSYGCFNLISPRIRLRFDPKDLKGQFKDDEMLMGNAVYTTAAVGTDHMGLTGVFKQACNGRMLKRMAEHPGQACFGMVKLMTNPVGPFLLVGVAAFSAFRKFTHANDHYQPIVN